MKIVVVKYNAGNILSVIYSLKRLGFSPILSEDAEEIRTADKVIFPGVGEASTAMEYLKTRGLDKIIRSIKKPVLGICLGLQLLCKHTEEGNTECLNIFNTNVRKFPATEKVPHIGWNNFTMLKSSLFDGITTDSDVYYVHSYYAEINNQTIATCDYIKPFGAAMQYKNFYATQFHPEKSADIGEQILKNFLSL